MANIYSLDVSAANNASTGGMNWAEGQSPGTVNNSARQMAALIAQFLADIGGNLEAGGTANALTLTANSDFTEYADGIIVSFKASADNTSTATLSVNGVGAKAIRKMTSEGEAGLDAGDIVDGYTYVVRYSESANSAAGAWLLDWAPTPAARTDYVPTGAVLPFAGSTAPTDFLLCDGSAVSRTTYSALFTAISTTYGAGDGSTTFNLPDLRGRVVAGKDNMGGTSANRLTDQTGGLDGDTLGDTGGSETHTLTEAQLPAITPTFTGNALAAHGHPTRVSAVDEGSAQSDPTGGMMLRTTSAATFSANTGSASNTAGDQIGGASAGTPTGTISSFGSDDAHNNVQPTIILNYIIRT